MLPHEIIDFENIHMFYVICQLSRVMRQVTVIFFFPKRILQLHHWFKSYRDLAGRGAFWPTGGSCIGKGKLPTGITHLALIKQTIGTDD